MSEAQWQRQMSEDIGEIKADVRAVRDRLDALPCREHAEKMQARDARITQLEKNGCYQRGFGRAITVAIAALAALLAGGTSKYVAQVLGAVAGALK